MTFFMVTIWTQQYLPAVLKCAIFTTLSKLETKAMTTSSQCNTGRIRVTLPITTRENTSPAIHVAQKITIIGAQKIGKFAV